MEKLLNGAIFCIKTLLLQLLEKYLRKINYSRPNESQLESDYTRIKSLARAVK